MPPVPMKQILDEADRGGYGVGAFGRWSWPTPTA
jgi:hypothetical protein